MRAVIVLLALLITSAAWAAYFHDGLQFGAGLCPGFAPMQRGSAGEVVDPWAWVPTSPRIQLLPGDFVMADATKIARWNDSSGNNYHASSTVSLYQPTRDGDGVLFNRQFSILYLPQESLPLTATWTSIFWADLYSGFDPTNPTGFRIWMGEYYQPSSWVGDSATYYWISGNYCPSSGFARPSGSIKRVFVVGNNGTNTFYDDGTNLFTGAGTFAPTPTRKISIGNTEDNGFSMYINAKMHGFWFYNRILSASEISAFRSNLQ